MLVNGVFVVRFARTQDGVTTVENTNVEYTGEDWQEAWLNSMIRLLPDAIFFLVAETTDVFEKEFDFNEFTWREVDFG